MSLEQLMVLVEGEEDVGCTGALYHQVKQEGAVGCTGIRHLQVEQEGAVG
jgi:hypothetical protein